ncbi:EAL domain-containing protein [Xylophilus ampelinus]|uniref:EAL domain-containing protein (Putative c-di-GMP-specific phosphodiesterase class I) n=1 Tax=Xylophilus ampelinus TaxID=54067 RepID=A0A318SG09_9BURK|nr:EAL domain-containing protein [Xylophilus ampelinus]MCS4510601.1 EAL domain-containing protein [Xylophilus ampelinus]PYE77773.1 EAL domain-containing protein (putative c-di-GMP-specific phosphodiesterase class I) [Xylophilus ampelinus]
MPVLTALPAAARPAAFTFAQRRRDLRTLARLMRYRQLNVLFQPLVDLHEGTIFGHEALVRGPVNTPLHTPDALLALARGAGVLAMFELLCLETALADWHRAQGSGRLFLHIGADALVQALRRHGAAALLAHLQRLKIDPRMLVLELTEHERMADKEALRDAVWLLRAGGVGLALDDFGDGRSSLLRSELRPEFVKLDKCFIRALHGSDGPENLRLTQALLGVAEAFGTQLVAEGIETAADLRLLRELRIPCGQGYLMGRPAPLPRQQVAQAARTVLGETPSRVPLRQRPPMRPGMLRGFPRIVDIEDDIDALAAILPSHDRRYLSDGFTADGRYTGMGIGEQQVRTVTAAPAARAHGGIHGDNRDGQPRFFYPCTTRPIGVEAARGGQFRHADEVASLAAPAKHDARLARQPVLVRTPEAPRAAATPTEREPYLGGR